MLLAQQCAEKALKGLLHWRIGDHPRIHLIAALLDELASNDDVSFELDAELRTLDKYYTTTRYPDTLDYALPAASFSTREADAALAIASSIVARVAELLPSPPVQRRREEPK